MASEVKCSTPIRPATVAHCNTARIMVREKLLELRSDPHKLAEFSRECSSIVRERARRSSTPRAPVVPKPPDAAIASARARRQEQRCQFVMNSPRSFFPDRSEGDTLELRRLVVCIIHGIAYRKFSETLLKHRMRGRRRIQEGKPLSTFYDFSKSFEYQRRLFDAAAILDTYSLRFSVKRRILAKRRGLHVIRTFFVLRKYFAGITSSIREYKEKVVACQCICRRWISRRRRVISVWRTIWRKLEGEPFQDTDILPWFVGDIQFRPRVDVGTRLHEKLLMRLLNSVWSAYRRRQGEGKVTDVELRQLLGLCINSSDTDLPSPSIPLPPPSSL